MLPIERDGKPTGGLYLNKNIYDRRDILIWPAYTPVTSRLLNRAARLGIRLSEDDWEAADETISRAADTAMEELGEVFREAGETGRIRLRELRRSTVPLLAGTFSAGSLLQFLVHLRRKDDQTLRHSVGVAALSVMLGRWLNLSRPELEKLALAALLHDIGKLRIDRRLLAKPDKLNAAEYQEIKKHAVYGYDMLRSNEEVPEVCALAALRHHERYNGSGYPAGLAGEAIDRYSRIIAVTDVFHAMSSKRPYKERLPFYRVVREMHASAFGQFDPCIILPFLSNMMESLIGSDVTLTNGERARILALTAGDPFRPLVQTNHGFLDLSKNTNIRILGYE